MSGAGSGGDRSPSVVEAEVPAEKFALARTFGAVAGVVFRCERVVENGDTVVMPLVWSHGAPRDELVRTLADDPSVVDASVLAEFDGGMLHWMEWGDGVDLVFGMLANSDAVLLDGRGENGTWTFRLLYPDREALSRTNEFCDEHGLPLDVRSIQEMESERVGRFGLTTAQFEALRTAREQGYFEVPRRVELTRLADCLDISHQALSERLRRARAELVRETLLAGPTSE